MRAKGTPFWGMWIFIQHRTGAVAAPRTLERSLSCGGEGLWWAKVPLLGGPQLPGGNLLVYPPDPSSRAGKLLHNRANSELRSLLVGPPTTTTPKLKQARWALGHPVRWEPRHACSHCFGAHLTHRTRLIFSVAAAMKL